MRKFGWGILAVLVLSLMAVAPLSVKADGLAVNARIGGGDENAHFDFRSGEKHYHPMLWKAAVRLREARRALWGARGEFDGHRLKAIGAIDAALDEIKLAAESADGRR